MGEGSENKSLDSVCEVSTVFSESENVQIQWGRSRRGKMGSKRWGGFEESSSQDKAMHVIRHSGNAQGESWPRHSRGHKHRHTDTHTWHAHNAHAHMHRHTHTHTRAHTHRHARTFLHAVCTKIHSQMSCLLLFSPPVMNTGSAPPSEEF